MRRDSMRVIHMPEMGPYVFGSWPGGIYLSSHNFFNIVSNYKHVGSKRHSERSPSGSRSLRRPAHLQSKNGVRNLEKGRSGQGSGTGGIYLRCHNFSNTVSNYKHVGSKRYSERSPSV